VSWAINEKFDVEQQVVRVICHEIARGVWVPGDQMPTPESLARDRILSPRAVESAFARLVEIGLLERSTDGATRVAADARRLAQDQLLRLARAEVDAIRTGLRHAGISAEAVERIFRESPDV